MSSRSSKFLVATVTAAAACMFVAATGYAQKTNPFAKFGGNWNGHGEIYLSNGTKENIRCRGEFTTTDSLNVTNLKLDLKCANPGYKFELQSDLNHESGAVTGTWTEMSRGVNGKVNGKIKDDQIQAVAESQTFTATLEITNFGDKQHVMITSPGSEIASVRIGLVRSGARPPQQNQQTQ